MDVKSLEQLQTSLARIDGLIREAVVRAHAAGHDPTDALRGLIISDDEVQQHLSKGSLTGLWTDEDSWLTLPPISPDEDNDLPFLHLINAFGLTTLDSYIFLMCLAPELDRRYERLYAYLQDDVSQRRPTVNLVTNLLGGNVTQRFAVWERLQPENPLRAHHLVDCVPDPTQRNPSFLAYHIKIDHRIVSHLLGGIDPDKRLKDAVKYESPDAVSPIPDEITNQLRDAIPECPMVYVLGAEEMGQREMAAALCGEYGLPLISANLAQLAMMDISFDLAWQLVLREALLTDGAVIFTQWESCLNEKRQPPTEFWARLLNYPRPVFLCGEQEWEPLDTYRNRRLMRIVLNIPDYPIRRDAWAQFADDAGVRATPEEFTELANKFRFTHHQIARAIHTAADLAKSRGTTTNGADLYAGARAHAGLRLGHHAKRIIPRFGWDDLILPPEQLDQLHEMTAWARHSHTVYKEWGFGKKIANMQGISALFAGESGTGKTLAAEVIAKDLGLVLYKIELSAVVSKYIGETEKNLSVIFSEARSGNAILFFDEADALFGKRSEVKDARDRYANIEIAYLLQEIEGYDGIAILATNLRQNLDEAFTRRLDFLIDFPFPESDYQRKIWLAHFPKQAPLADDIDLGQLSERYDLAGGNIRNVAVGAAYLAADDGGLITLQHLHRAIRREHQKMGRLLDDSYAPK